MKANCGFTLIELMVVVLVVAILAAWAVPTYQDQVRKARRADAQADLMQVVQFMERFFTQNNTYVGATLPITQSPRSGQAFYTIQFAAAPTATAYEVRAVPQGSQAADRCGTMSITQNNVRNAAYPDCWR